MVVFHWTLSSSKSVSFSRTFLKKTWSVWSFFFLWSSTFLSMILEAIPNAQLALPAFSTVPTTIGINLNRFHSLFKSFARSQYSSIFLLLLLFIKTKFCFLAGLGCTLCITKFSNFKPYNCLKIINTYCVYRYYMGFVKWLLLNIHDGDLMFYVNGNYSQLRHFVSFWFDLV